MRLTPLCVAMILAVATGFSFSPNAAAWSPQDASTDAQTIHNYTLTEDFLKKWETISADPYAPVCNLLTLNLEGDSLSESIAEYDARPGNHAYLAKHGLTARDMILGTGTMLLAGLQQAQKSHPGLVDDGENAQVSQQNMAFYLSHKDEVHEVMQKAGKGRLRRDGGKTPDCNF